MTLRNPERLFILDADDYEADQLENDLLNPIHNSQGLTRFPLGAPVHPRIAPPTPILSAHASSRISLVGYSDVIHPVFTDFGPETLAQYLRREIENIRSQVTSASSKAKGKGRASSQSSSPPRRTRLSKGARASDTTNSRSILHPTTPNRLLQKDPKPTPSPAALCSDKVPQAQPDDDGDGLCLGDLGGQRPLHDWYDSHHGQNITPTSGTRRSRRLAGRGIPPISTLQEQEPPLLTPNHSNPLFPSVDTAHHYGPGQTSISLRRGYESRRSRFEAHTKSKREAVRAGTVETLSAPEEMDTNIGHLTDQPRSRKAASRPTDSVSVISVGQGLAQTQPSTSQQGALRLDEMQTASPHDLGPKFSPDRPQSIGAVDTCAPISFDYSQVVPQSIPKSFIKVFSDSARKQKSQPIAAAAELQDPIVSPSTSTTATTPVPPSTSMVIGRKIEEGAVRLAMEAFPRVLQPPSLSLHMGQEPRFSSKAGLKPSYPDGLDCFNADLWLSVTQYLSTRDVGNLRLVNTQICEALSSIQFRNVVINFDKPFFDNNDGVWNGKSTDLPPNSMFQKYGDNLNQFGIAFEYNMTGLSNAKAKVIEREENAWFGKFTWPTEQYPRFPELQKIEDLVDHNRPLLKEAFKYVTKASELGLCIDSGHGWLEGPDMSDMALLDRRASRGSKIFGKTFQGVDVLDKLCRDEYFKWAQKNTINEAVKYVMQTRSPSKPAALTEIRALQNTVVREMDSFRFQHEQHDFDPESHVGGAPGSIAPVAGNPNALVHWAVHFNPALHHPAANYSRTTSGRQVAKGKPSQWPLIFNGHNIAADLGGHCAFIQNRTAPPINACLRPCALTEAQAQWLMETVWAQRAFLSSYTTAIITNKNNFKHIHTLRISKLSSGLLPSLEQKEFWTSLPSLEKLQMLISPDWRQEHVTGDRCHQTSMLIPPHKAAQRFTDFLKVYVIPIESLHGLTIGYVGGGEHAVGIFARNQHVLPAPIVDDPTGWLLQDEKTKHRAALTKFEHIRDLKFENCWFSPTMLDEFMHQSRDTSLHSLTLDSVSLLTRHDPSLEQPLATGGSNLRCHHEPAEWIQEQIPFGATWTQVLDNITPGATLLDLKYDAGLVDEKVRPKPRKPFRGHIQKIILRSCGYVTITLPKGMTGATFNQYSAVVHLLPSVDSGIRVRRDRFKRPVSLASSPETYNMGLPTPLTLAPRQDPVDSGFNRTVMNTASPDGEMYPWLGTLTQCIHPIEKRVLEMAWNLKFGWPGDLERWAAVEDGFFEGGTGRFSGTIDKDTKYRAAFDGKAHDEILVQS